MANDCDYEMKVVGSKEDIEEFLKVMKADYDYCNMTFNFERHMGGRVFEAEPTDIVEQENGKFSIIISGYCAWSVYSCMFEGGATYYTQFKKEYGDKSRSTTLPNESKRLRLDIEIYSEESGMGFQEHYLVKHGHVEEEETREWYGFFLDDYSDDYETKEEAEKELGVKITDKEWENKEYISRGGFGKWTWNI